MEGSKEDMLYQGKYVLRSIWQGVGSVFPIPCHPVSLIGPNWRKNAVLSSMLKCSILPKVYKTHVKYTF